MIQCLIFGNNKNIKCFCLGLEICREKKCLKQKNKKNIRKEITNIITNSTLWNLGKHSHNALSELTETLYAIFEIENEHSKKNI